jgi:hypothetical protein
MVSGKSCRRFIEIVSCILYLGQKTAEQAVCRMDGWFGAAGLFEKKLCLSP